MKKVFVIALALALTLGCVSGYAAAPRESGLDRELFGKVDFEAASGFVGSSFLSNGIGSGENQIREDWTNSRGLDNEGAKFVNLGSEESPNVAVEVTGSAFTAADFNANAAGSTAGVQLVAYADIKYVKDAEFCGLVLDYVGGAYGSTTDSFACVHPGFILDSGYGFSLRAGNKMDIFVNASAAGTVDAGSIDLGAYGIDCSKFVTYAIYRTTEKVVYISANNILVGKINFSAEQPQILNADGTVAAAASGDPSWTNNNYNTDGKPFFGIVGDGDTDVIFDNIGYEEFTTLPTFATASEEPKTEAPAEAAPALDSSVVWNCDPYTDPLGPWLNDDAGRTISAVFNVDKPFNEIVLNVFWGSNPPDFGSGKYNIEVSIYKFAYNYANSIAGTPVATAKITDCAGDNYNTVPSFSEEGTNLTLRGANNGLQAVLGSDLPAGQYVMVITNDGEAGGYIVLPNVGENLADNKFVRGADGEATPFRFGVNTNGQFVALIADSDVPAPQTGDTTVAMFAVIAVVALAAVVVFKKRVNG